MDVLYLKYDLKSSYAVQSIMELIDSKSQFDLNAPLLESAAFYLY